MCPARTSSRGLAAAAVCLLALTLASGTAAAQSSAASSASPSGHGEVDEAVALHRGYQSAPTARERELAQYRLAIALHQLKFHQAAYAIFSEIADHPSHAGFEGTLAWLGRLATYLPEPADVDERIGKYDEMTIDRLQVSQRELYWRLSYLLGRYKYRNHQYDVALRLFAKVDRQSRQHYAKAQFYSGVAYVHMRRPLDAVRSFKNIIETIDALPDDLDDERRLRDLAHLSIARTYYSASVHVDGRGAPALDRSGLTAALEKWKAVDASSEYWLEAFFEQSWAYFMMGDHARALGNVHMIRSSDFPLYSPEVDILRSTIYVANCQYDDAATLAARFHGKYQPIATELTRTLAAMQGADQDELFYKFAKDVRDGRDTVAALIRPAVAHALSDRQFLRHLQYVVVLEDELKRFGKAPPALRDSPLGHDMKEATQLARDIAVRNAAELARDRSRRELDELNAHLRDNVGLLVGAMAGQRGQLDVSLLPGRIPARDADRNVVQADEEHVIWPFTGEVWKDEVGSYRQSIRSKCR